MIIECDTCVVRGPACEDCVVSVLLQDRPATGGVDLDGAERVAIATLARSGLVPPLRLLAVTRTAPAEASSTTTDTVRHHRAVG
ncbi:MAG: hypothetical protein QG622_992 [Actinomycetota bacterium]|nr:hypothetical protein [Actinomycetota bacterium]